MGKLGIAVATSETAGSAGVSIQTGTAFILGLTDSGPSTPQLIGSEAAYVSLYGERTATSSVSFDAVSTFFNLNGARCYFLRVGKEASGKRAEPAAQLKAAAHAEAIKVVAKYVGTLGNKLQVEVKESGAEYEVVILNAASEVLETTGLLKEAKQLIGLTSPYVIYEEGTKYAEGKTEKLEKLAAKKLEGGVNPSATITEALVKEALELLPKTLGPGQVLIPATAGEPVEEKVHILMGEHSLKTNRVALCDIADSAVTATLIGNKKTYAAGIAGYMAFFSSSCVIAGVTLGTTRTIPASVIAAGLCAQVAKTENDNQAPAGVQWTGAGQGLAGVVTGFTNTFSKTNMELLAENGINPFAERQTKLVLYDFVSALPRTTDKIFCQFSASRERMHLVWAAEEVAEGFLFLPIDGRKQLFSAFQNALQAMLLRQYNLKALFGETAQEAFLVNLAEPVNTLTTQSEGQLNAELRVRLSPYAEAINLTIVSSSVAEPV